MGSRRSKLRGFTALELLFVVAIAGVLAALAIPSFSELRRGAGVSSSANQMLWALHYARSSAILRNLPAVVCLSADGATCLPAGAAQGSGWLIFLDSDRSSPPRLSPGDELLHQIRLPEGFTVRGTRAAVTYWPISRAGTTATFTICADHGASQGRAVVVSQTGRPRVEGAVPCAR